MVPSDQVGQHLVMSLRVLIVDDHERFRASARRMLEKAGFEVVGELATGMPTLSTVRQVEPDVVLLDVQLPDSDGFTIARALRDAGATCRVVLTSSRDWSDSLELVAGTGAAGFLPKDELSGAALSALVA
jgi:DNA-binding NarL/FixJ family response regulator